MVFNHYEFKFFIYKKYNLIFFILAYSLLYTTQFELLIFKNARDCIYHREILI